MNHHRADDGTLREFGSLVVRKRQKLGLTSREMAREIGISQTCLSRIENGTREIRLDILRKLHTVLDLSTPLLRYLKTGRFHRRKNIEDS